MRNFPQESVLCNDDRACVHEENVLACYWRASEPPVITMKARDVLAGYLSSDMHQGSTR